VPELSDWTWWWAFNEDPYVDLRRRVRARGSLTGSDAFYLGRGPNPSPTGLAPGDELVQDRIGPALLRAHRAEREPFVSSAALIALAKLHPRFDDGIEAHPVELARRALQSPRREAVEAAILALGLCAEPESAALLVDLATDAEGAARLLSRDSVPMRWRVHAALALGLVGARSEREDVRRYLVSPLARMLAEEKPAAPDLHIACITAIGMTPLAEGGPPALSEDGRAPRPAASRLGQVAFLADLLEDRRRPEFVRAHLPRALARLAREAEPALQEEVKRRLIDLLSSRKRSERLVRYGIVEALGLVGDADAEPLDVELRALLRRFARDGDAFEQNLALISLALVSSRRGAAGPHPLEALRGEQVYLMKAFSQSRSRTRPWAALALGLQGYHARAAGGDLFDSTSKALRWTFERTRAPGESSAFCIALGLRRDLEAVPAMLERLDSIRDDAARGRVAIGLGLAGAREAIQPLQAIVDDSRYRPTLLRDAAVALALLGQKRVALDLVEILAEAKSSAVRGTAVGAIGFVGDARVVEPLIELLEDPGLPELVRADAATALGLVCESEPFHWTAGFNNAMNYHALVATLNDPSGTGFLDRR